MHSGVSITRGQLNIAFDLGRKKKRAKIYQLYKQRVFAKDRHITKSIAINTIMTVY